MARSRILSVLKSGEKFFQDNTILLCVLQYHTKEKKEHPFNILSTKVPGSKHFMKTLESLHHELKEEVVRVTQLMNDNNIDGLLSSNVLSLDVCVHSTLYTVCV